MRNIAILVKIQLYQLFSLNKMRRSVNHKEAQKMGRFALLMLFVGVMLMFSSFFYCWMMAEAYAPLNLLPLLPIVAMIGASMLTLLSTIYRANGVLFAFQDYETIMSLPIKNSHIIISRLLLLYGMNTLFSLFVLIPATVVYAIKAAPSPSFYVFSVLGILLVPLLPIIIGTILGMLIGVATARFRHKNVAHLVLMIALICAFMIVSMDMPRFMSNFAGISQSVIGTIGSAYPPVLLYAMAITENQWLPMLGFVALSIVPFALFAVVVGRVYRKMNSLLLARKTSARYKMTNLRGVSPRKALYRKECRRYFSSPLYVMNTAVGMIMLTLAAGAAVVLGRDKLGALLEMPDFVAGVNQYLPVVIAFFITLSPTTATSLSLEGKQLWILKSLPIHIRDIFFAKMALNVTVIVPFLLVDILLFAIALHPTWLQLVTWLVLSLLYTAYTAVVGLVINLIFPKLDWSSEVTVIKQSAAVIVAMLTGWGAALVPLIALLTLPMVNPLWIHGGTAVVLAAVTAVLYRYQMTKGRQRFEALS